WPLKLLVDFALGNAALPMFLGFVNELPVPRTTALLLMVAAVSAGLFVLSTLLEIGMTRAWASYGDGMVYDLAADLFHKLQRMSLVSHARRTVGDSLGRLTGDAYCLYGLVQSVILPVQHLLTLISVGFIAWKLDPRLAGLSLVIAPVQVGAGLFFGPRLKRRAQQSRKTE